jgi:hypothetical protein
VVGATAALAFSMRSSAVSIALAAVAGCHSTPHPEAPRPAPKPKVAEHPDRAFAREVLGAMNDFTDEACACADASCVSSVQVRMNQWAEPRLPRMKALTPTADENERASALHSRMQVCLTRFDEPTTMPLTGAAILDQLSSFKDEICACTEPTCVAGVQERMMAWALANLEAMKGIDPTSDEDAQAERIDAELAACMRRIDGISP